jgi:hypothetical protein
VEHLGPVPRPPKYFAASGGLQEEDLRRCFMSAGAGAAAAAAAIAAIKASGVIVVVEPDEFVGILKRQPGALVVHATGGLFSTNYRYLTSYKGLAFYTKAREPLNLPPGTELVHAKAIWVPGG